MRWWGNWLTETFFKMPQVLRRDGVPAAIAHPERGGKPAYPASLRWLREGAGLGGGGGSLERTRLRAEFPGNREIYREFHASGAVLRRSNREEVPANRPFLGIRKLPDQK